MAATCSKIQQSAHVLAGSWGQHYKEALGEGTKNQKNSSHNQKAGKHRWPKESWIT